MTATATVLASFDGINGSFPDGQPRIDSDGNIVGVANFGGASSYGVIYEIPASSTGYGTTATALASLPAGEEPGGSLQIDRQGDLFGVAGPLTNMVFELAKSSTGYANTITTLATFTGSIAGPLILSSITDSNGDLFGAIQYDYQQNVGIIFEISRNAAGFASTPTILGTIAMSGDGLYAPAYIDAQGDLFGVAGGGSLDVGMVWELSNTATGYASAPTILASFDTADGSDPIALGHDDAGDLYLLANKGGANAQDQPTDDGLFDVLYRTPYGYSTATGSPQTPTILTTFTSSAANPIANFDFDADQNVFGLTGNSSTGDGDTLFEIPYANSTGYAASPTVILDASAIDAGRLTGLTADSQGNLLISAETAGSNQNGAIIEVTGSGFVPSAPTESYVAPSTLPSSTVTTVTGGGSVALDGPAGETFYQGLEPVSWQSGAGQSIFVGNAQSATVQGASSGSTVVAYLGSGHALVDGGAGATTVVGGTGNFVYQGSFGNDTVFAGAADSATIEGGPGRLTFVGGSGTANASADSGGAIWLGSGGGDAYASGANVTLVGGDNAYLRAAPAGGDVLLSTGQATLDASYSSGGNVMFGGGGIELGTGADTVIGTGSNQTILGEYGDFTSFANGSATYSLTSDGQTHADFIIGFVQGVDHLALSGFSNIAAYGFANETVVRADNTTINIFGISTNSVASLT